MRQLDIDRLAEISDELVSRGRRRVVNEGSTPLLDRAELVVELGVLTLDLVDDFGGLR